MTDDRKHYTNRIAEVSWVDSSGHDGWHEEFNEIADKITSVGYVIREDDKQVIIAQAISLTHNPFCSQMSIPKVAITKIRNLRNRK